MKKSLLAGLIVLGSVVAGHAEKISFAKSERFCGTSQHAEYGPALVNAQSNLQNKIYNSGLADGCELVGGIVSIDYEEPTAELYLPSPGEPYYGGKACATVTCIVP